MWPGAAGCHPLGSLPMNQISSSVHWNICWLNANEPTHRFGSLDIHGSTANVYNANPINRPSALDVDYTIQQQAFSFSGARSFWEYLQGPSIRALWGAFCLCCLGFLLELQAGPYIRALWGECCHWNVHAKRASTTDRGNIEK